MHYLILLLISMVPLIELRGAVPYGIANGIPFWQALSLGVLGNMLPVPIIFFFAHKVLVWGADKPVIGPFFSWCLRKGQKGGKVLEEKAGKNGIFLALLLFVGIPIPGTGAWTGTLAASILGWDFKKSVVVIMLGVILAGVIMGLLTVFGLNVFSH
ncbi:COG2426 family protein [Streptococcus rifensis]